MLNLFNQEQTETIKNEAYQTVKTGFDFVQWGLGLMMANPLQTIGLVGLLTLALGGWKLKLDKFLDIKL